MFYSQQKIAASRYVIRNEIQGAYSFFIPAECRQSWRRCRLEHMVWGRPRGDHSRIAHAQRSAKMTKLSDPAAGGQCSSRGRERERTRRKWKKREREGRRLTLSLFSVKDPASIPKLTQRITHAKSKKSGALEKFMKQRPPVKCLRRLEAASSDRLTELLISW